MKKMFTLRNRPRGRGGDLASMKTLVQFFWGSVDKGQSRSGSKRFGFVNEIRSSIELDWVDRLSSSLGPPRIFDFKHK